MTAPPSPAVRALLVAHLAAFAVQWAFGAAFAPFVLWPWGHGFAPWQLLTHGFLHSGPEHLAFNLLGLWIFGRAVEQALGARRFVAYYLACIAGAGLLQLAVATLEVRAGGPVRASLGASGGVYGVLLAVGVLYPRVVMRLYFPPIAMPAWFMALGYGVSALVMGVTGSQEGVAHFAHLGGMVSGLALLLAWRRRPPP